MINEDFVHLLITVRLSDREWAVELRDIEMFLVLAEELHFGRTAERLNVSQARVSQSIRKQERRIGAQLFERTSRRVTLTPVGERLRSDLQQAYDLINTGLTRASAVGAGIGGTVRLGVMGALGSELRPVMDTFSERHPDCDVAITEYHFSDPFGALRAGGVDLQLMWLPVREPDLAVGPTLLTEGRVLAVSSASELAGRESVSMEDLGDQITPSLSPAMPDYWEEAMLPRFTPLGRPIRRGPEARTFHEILTLVAEGKAACPLNAHVSWYYNHPGITCVPIHDAPVTEWALVWLAGAVDPSVGAFTQAARSCEPRHITASG